METIIREIKNRLQAQLPADANHLTIQDFRTAAFPEPLIDRLQVEINAHLSAQINRPKSDWIQENNPAVHQAWNSFLQNLQNHSQLPTSELDRLLDRSIRDLVEQLVEPRKNIPLHIFGDQRALTYDQITEKSPYIVVNRHLTAGLLRYMDRRNLRLLPYEKCVDVIAQIDHKLTEQFSPINWSQLMDPWFTLFGKRIDADLIRRFFRDKRLNELADAIPNQLHDLNKTELIERLSAPDLPIAYHIYDDQIEKDAASPQRIQPLEHAGTYYEEFLKLRETNRKKWAHRFDKAAPNIQIEPAISEITLAPKIAEHTAPAYQEEDVAVLEETPEVDSTPPSLNEQFSEDTVQAETEKLEPDNGLKTEELEDFAESSINEQFVEESSVEEDDENLKTFEDTQKEPLQRSAPAKTEEKTTEKIAAELSFHDLAEEGILDDLMNEEDEGFLSELTEETDEAVEKEETNSAAPTTVSEPEKTAPAAIEEDSENEDAFDIDSMFGGSQEKEVVEEAAQDAIGSNEPAEKTETAAIDETDPSENFDIDEMFSAPKMEDPVKSKDEDLEALLEEQKRRLEEKMNPKPKEQRAAESTSKPNEDSSDDADFDIDSMFGGSSSKDEEVEEKDEGDFDIDSMFGSRSAENVEDEEKEAQAAVASSDEDFDIDSMFGGDAPKEDAKAKDDDINALFADSNEAKEEQEEADDFDALFSDSENVEENNFTATPKIKQLAEHEGLLEYLADSHSYFIKELFDHDAETFNHCIGDIDSFDDWSEASEYLNNDIFAAFGIDMISEPAIKFIDEVQNYFNTYKAN